MNLGLIAVNGITSGSPGGPLTFSGIRGLLLATQNGSITLGPEISFSGLHDITLYARGAGSVLTLASDISTTSDIRLYGERRHTSDWQLEHAKAHRRGRNKYQHRRRWVNDNKRQRGISADPELRERQYSQRCDRATISRQSGAQRFQRVVVND